MDQIINDQFQWLFPPSKKSELNEKNECIIVMDPKTDFWKRTYYNPILLNDNGHFLYKNFQNNIEMKIQVQCQLKPVNQFDQCGLMIRIDSENWAKFGVEVVDKQAKLSVVITRDGYSDWSTQDWNDLQFTIRINKIRDSIVCEIMCKDNNYKFIRIGHLDFNQSKQYMLGIYACSPIDKGGEAHFSNLQIEPCLGYDHKAD